MGALSHGRIEVMILPVTDIDRAKSFYVDRVGFDLDVDYEASADFRVVQITPPGSACSVQLVEAAGPIEPRETYLVVVDVVSAREALRRQGVEVSPLRHKHPRDAWVGGWAEGVDPDRTPYASFADFTDPDRHRWVMQEIGPE
jgi:catechol 2,3-dioxygenase-like lactoylglutathione lyase family enzyme